MYDSTATKIDPANTTSSTTVWPVALSESSLSTYVNAGYTQGPPGGANSDYTAADFQHMLLAAQVPNAAVPGGIQTLPSFHRPALINYWINQINPTTKTFAGLWNSRTEPGFVSEDHNTADWSDAELDEPRSSEFHRQ